MAMALFINIHPRPPSPSSGTLFTNVCLLPFYGAVGSKLNIIIIIYSYSS